MVFNSSCKQLAVMIEQKYTGHGIRCLDFGRRKMATIRPAFMRNHDLPLCATVNGASNV